MMRAAAAAAWQEGVSSIHLFNYDAHASGKGKPGTLFSPSELQALRQIGDPEKIARRDKHYYVTRDMGGRTAEAGGEMQLPTEITESNQTRELSFTVGDDLEAAQKDGVLESVSLLLALEGYDRWDDDLRVDLNGQRLRGAFGEGVLRFEDMRPKQGDNLLAGTLRNHPQSRLQEGCIRRGHPIISSAQRCEGFVAEERRTGTRYIHTSRWPAIDTRWGTIPASTEHDREGPLVEAA